MYSVSFRFLFLKNFFIDFLFFLGGISYALCSEAATGGVLRKKIFLKISQNSQKKTCVGVSFLINFEQVILLLGQASLSYTRRLKILKMITKNPRKAKTMLKENENVLRESETHAFGKKIWSHMIEIEKSRKKSLEAFKDVDEKKTSFRKGPSHSQNEPHGGGCYYYAGKPGSRDEHNKYGRFQSPFQDNRGKKLQYGSSATQGKYLFRKSKGGSFHQQLKTDTTGINDYDNSSSKKITKEIPNVPGAGRIGKTLHATKKFCL